MHECVYWSLSDPEQRLGFHGGRFTRVNYLLTFLLAAFLTAAFFAALYPFRKSGIALAFYRDGSITIAAAISFFTFWALVILCLKWLKLRLQRKTLSMQIIPSEPDFVLSPATVGRVEQRISECVDNTRQFVLFNRIEAALSNLRNMGRVGDVAEILKTQADYDEATMETSYLAVSAFVWAVPVLGFIGTVVGLSAAIGKFGTVLKPSGGGQGAVDMTAIKDSLLDVTGGLATAFETTMQGLVAALVVQLIMVAMKKAEQEFLDDCNEYCSRHVVSKLRLLPLDEEGLS